MPACGRTSVKIVAVRPLQFDSLCQIPGLHHALTTREGGFSGGAFASLNLAFHVGDDAAIVRENRRALAAKFGYDAETLVAAQQVHGARCAVISSDDGGRGALDWDSALPDTDALITRESGVPLLILVADCAPILLVEPRAHVVAVVHAGWRGALAGIAGIAARQMIELGADIRQIRAGIGPCLCPENLEVGAQVAALFADKSALEPFGDKYRLDLRALIQRDLGGAGVAANHIETRIECPRDDARFFSHRGQNGVAGRFGIVAWWE